MWQPLLPLESSISFDILMSSWVSGSSKDPSLSSLSSPSLVEASLLADVLPSRAAELTSRFCCKSWARVWPPVLGVQRLATISSSSLSPSSSSPSSSSSLPTFCQAFPWQAASPWRLPSPPPPPPHHHHHHHHHHYHHHHYHHLLPGLSLASSLSSRFFFF